MSDHIGPLLSAVFCTRISWYALHVQKVDQALRFPKRWNAVVPPLPGCRLFRNDSDTDMLRALQEATVDHETAAPGLQSIRTPLSSLDCLVFID